MRIGTIDIELQPFIELVKRKLAVPGNLPVNVSSKRMDGLEAQIETRLRPVLREADYQSFDVQRAIDAVVHARPLRSWTCDGSVTVAHNLSAESRGCDHAARCVKVIHDQRKLLG